MRSGSIHLSFVGIFLYIFIGPRRRAGRLPPGRRWAAPGCRARRFRARSRLYRHEILQENVRLKALAEIYTMHSFALL